MHNVLRDQQTCDHTNGKTNNIYKGEDPVPLDMPEYGHYIISNHGCWNLITRVDWQG